MSVDLGRTRGGEGRLSRGSEMLHVEDVFCTHPKVTPCRGFTLLSVKENLSARSIWTVF